MDKFRDSSEQGLYMAALGIQDQYWADLKSHNETAPKTELMFIGCYVRFHRGSLEIHWKKLTPGVDQKTGQKITKYLKKGRASKYSKSVIEKAAKTEKELMLVMEYEEKFAEIREIFSSVKHLARAYTKAKKRLDDVGVSYEE